MSVKVAPLRLTLQLPHGTVVHQWVYQYHLRLRLVVSQSRASSIGHHMIIELLDSTVKKRPDVYRQFLPYDTPRNPRVGPITGVRYTCDMQSHNKLRTFSIEFDDQSASLLCELRESHREAIKLKFKIGDPTFRLENVAELVDDWLHWRIKYKELGKDTR